MIEEAHVGDTGRRAHRARSSSIRSLLLVACAVAVTSGLTAESTQDGYRTLDEFMQGLVSLEADFHQTLLDRAGQVLEESSGQLAIARPNRFRWDYREPAGQLVIADGERLWLYDAELEQATVRPLDETLAGTPAMLLSGEGDLRDSFQVEGLEQRGTLSWILLKPLRADTDFQAVRLALEGQALVAMELDDKLGQTTVLELSAFKRNPVLDNALFHFEPPIGADVIGAPSLIGRPTN